MSHRALLVAIGITFQVICITEAISLPEETCDQELRQVVLGPDADAFVGVVLSLREPASGLYGCGEVDTSTSTMETYEALRWALNRINQDSGQVGEETVTDSYIPGLKLGLVVQDSCGRWENGIHSLMEFFPQMTTREDMCSQKNNSLFLGIIGETFSSTSLPLAKLLTEFKVPQVSFSATASSLTDGDYPYFMRTIPPDRHQAKVIAQMLSELRWEEFAIVYSDDVYGVEGYEALITEASLLGLCPKLVTKVTGDAEKGAANAVAELVASKVKAVVLFGVQTVAIKVLERCQGIAGTEDIQWIISDSIGTDQSVLGAIPYSRGILTVAPSSRQITEFENHWIGLDVAADNTDNPWLREWYMRRNKCKLTGSERSPFAQYDDCVLETESERRQKYTQNQYTEPAILSLYAFAKALKNAQVDLCPRDGILCKDLMEITTEDISKVYLKRMELRFSSDERIATLSSDSIEPFLSAKTVAFQGSGDIREVSYNVWNFNDVSGDFRFEKVGSYLFGRLDLEVSSIRMYDEVRDKVLNPIPSSSCPDEGCSQCVTITSVSGETPFAHIQGNALLGGVFPVSGINEEDPLRCGDLTVEGVLLSQAFMFAVERVQSARVFPNGFYIGALALDSCSTGVGARTTLTNIMRGEDKLITSDGLLVDVKSMQGMVVGNNDDVIINVADIMSQLEIPAMGFGATDADLTNAKQNPLFAQTTLDSYHQVDAIVQLLQQLNYDKVQLISSGKYGKASREIFMEKGAQNGICIVAEYEITDTNTPEDIIAKFTDNPETKVVVVFGSKTDYRNILSNMKEAGVARQFLLVSDISWGIDESILDGLEAEATNAITLQYNFPVQVAFNSYMKNLNITRYRKSNPWLGRLYEELHDCFFEEENPDGRDAPCSSAPITNANGYKTNPSAMFVVLGVEALARGLDKTLIQFCGDQYRTLCPEYLQADNKTDILMRNIRDINFNDEFGNAFSFDGSSGNVNVDIYRVQQGQYMKIGQYQPSRGVELYIRGLTEEDGSLVKSTCAGTCTQCLYVQKIGLNDHAIIPGDVMIGALLDIRETGSNPFQCGDVKEEQSVQFYQAFKMALDNVNNGKGPVELPGVTLGGLAFDDCSSPTRAASIVSSLHSRIVSVPVDGEDENVNPEMLLAWLTQSSPVSLGVGDVLSSLDVPQIGIASTAFYLKDPERLTTFYNTMTADDQTAQGIIGLLKYMGWKYVSMVSGMSERSSSAADAFKLAADNSGICLLNSYEIKSNGDTDTIVEDLAISTSHIVVIFGELEDVRQMLKAKRTTGSSASGLTFITGDIATSDFNDLVNGYEIPASYMITTKINSTPLPDFNDHMDTILPTSDDLSPWFKEYYQTLYTCNLPGSVMYSQNCPEIDRTSVVDSPDYKQDFYLLNVFNSVYSIASALNVVLTDVCGQNYTGICDDFKNSENVREMLRVQLDMVEFEDPTGATFHFKDREYQQGYTFYKFNEVGGTEEIASYLSGDIKVSVPDLHEVYDKVQAECGTQCMRCQAVMQQDEQFTYTNADVLFGGIFDVHEAGDSPFSCGKIKMDQGFQLLEAFNFAIDYVENRRGIFAGKLSGLTIGGLGLDACGSPTRAAGLLSNVHSGFLQLSKGAGGQDDRVRVERIDAYIGAMSSEMSLQIADILKVLGLPQISYGSPSTEFSDKTEYPDFLRTVPADDKLARAIVSVLRRFDLEYVQVVRSAGIYGETSSKAFIERARSSGICVAQEVQLEDAASNVNLVPNMDGAVRKLLEKPLAKVLVVLLKTETITPFLEAISRNPSAKSTFKLIGSDNWSDNLAVVAGLDDVIEDAITVGVETADLPEYDGYLIDNNAELFAKNPWFAEYYQAVFQCSLQPNSPDYPSQCTTNTDDIVRAPGYKQDPYVLYTVNAVYAAALGLHHALETTCGEGYNGLCQAYTNAPDRRKLLVEGIKKASFVDATKQMFEFTDNGESNRGYHIYTIRKSPGNDDQFYYDNVGSYNDTHQLKVDSQFEVTWRSDCSDGSACSECPHKGYQASRYASQPSKDNLNIMAFMSVHDAEDDDPLQCGNIGAGFYDMLAFFYAIDFVNTQGLGLIPAVKLGGVVVDTCGDSERVKQGVLSQIAAGYYCSVQDDITSASTVAYMVPDNEAAIATTNLLSPKRVLTISSGSTSDRIAGVPFYLSTMPTDIMEARALANIALKMNWVYVTLVTSEGDRYQAAKEEFLKTVAREESAVCVGEELTITSGMTQTRAEALVRKMDAMPGVRVVVTLTSPKDTELLLDAVWDLAKVGRFVFLGGSAWGTNPSIKNNLATRGSITVSARTAVSKDFMNYVKGLSVADHGSIPDDWFEEFWQQTLRCRLENATIIQEEYSNPCNSDDRLTDEVIISNEYALHTIIATQQIAIGLSSIVQCQSDPLGVSVCLQKRSDRGRLVYEAVKQADWRPRGTMQLTDPGFDFEFTNQGTGALGYIIYNVRFEDGVNFYREIGRVENDAVTFDPAEHKSYDKLGGDLDEPWTSQCQLGMLCNCTSGTGGSTRGRVSSGGAGTQAPAAVVNLNSNFTKVWAIVVAVLSGIGILVTLCLFVYLLIFYPNRGGTTAIGYLLMFGIILVYAANFAFILQANDIICGIRMFCQPFVYAFCFSCMLVKVLNTWRIGSTIEDYVVPTYERLSHPCTLVLIALFLTCVQVIIGVEFLVLKPPEHVWDTFEDIFEPRCFKPDFHYQEMLIVCVYVMFLILMTLVFSSMTWDSDENHQESRWLVIVCCATIVCWIIWGVMCTLTQYSYREPAITICNFVNATVILLGLFVRKLYLLNKYIKEEERSSRLSDLTESKDNGMGYNTIVLNEGYDGTMGSRKSVSRNGTMTRGYDPSAAGADVAY